MGLDKTWKLRLIASCLFDKFFENLSVLIVHYNIIVIIVIISIVAIHDVHQRDEIVIVRKLAACDLLLDQNTRFLDEPCINLDLANVQSDAQKFVQLRQPYGVEGLVWCIHFNQQSSAKEYWVTLERKMQQIINGEIKTKCTQKQRKIKQTRSYSQAGSSS